MLNSLYAVHAWHNNVGHEDIDRAFLEQCQPDFGDSSNPTRNLSAVVTSRVVSGFLGKGGRPEQKSGSKITPRETEVLTLIASAYSTKEIARKLDLSVKTVEKHRSNLMRKLGLKSTAAVTLYAVRNNYLSVDIDLTTE